MKKILAMSLITALMVTALVGCGKSVEKKDVSMDELVLNIKDKVIEDLKADGVTEDQFVGDQIPFYIEGNLTGENPDPMIEKFPEGAIESGIILQPMMNINSNLMIIIKASSEDQTAEIKKSLEGILKAQDDIWSQYLPDQYEKVKKNIITVSGQFIFYITYDDSEAMENVFLDTFINQ